MAWENRHGREVKEHNHVYKFLKKSIPAFDEAQINSVIDIVVNNGCLCAIAYLQQEYEMSMSDFGKEALYKALYKARAKDNRFYDTHRCV